MQGELDQAGTRVPIDILGVNAAGEDAGNQYIVLGRTLPWLQDTADAQVWSHWNVTWRDVIVLDQDNREIAVYNLTEHNLNRPAAYDSLKTILLNAAR